MSYPDGFPLKPVDTKGNKLVEGDRVKLLSIPEWLYGDFDSESAIELERCKGEVMDICEVDDYGYALIQKTVKDSSGQYCAIKFCMEPMRLLKLKD